MKKTRLRAYAALIARKGVNVQKGQSVIIGASLDQPEFVQMVAEECYKAGASKVTVEWRYRPLQKTAVRYQSLKTLSTMENWEIEKLKSRVEKMPCMISLTGDDPDGLKGINQKKHMTSMQKIMAQVKPYNDEVEGKYQWCVAGIPGEAWARKVFPGYRTSKAVEMLWEAILSTARVDDDPLAAWDKHNADLENRCKKLNEQTLRELIYHSANGTDLTVGLIPEAKFCGGGETSLRGVFFNPNIPSEECFTSPMAGKAEGIVYSTMPLSYQGELIEDFSVRFEQGKAVEIKAAKNQALLERMIKADEGACMLGECAFVPYDSPIRNSGLLFYNTLFDENASCHLALGRGYIDTIRDYDRYSLEQMRKMGINESVIHTDFMIGSPDLSVVGRREDGTEFEIFKDGNWAF